MNKTLLITRPKHDPTVHYLFYWAKKIIELARAKSITVIDLRGKRANHEEVISILQKKQPSLVFFNGHGNDGCILGYNDEVLVAVGKSENVLVSKIVYALSCRSGKELGPKSIQNGALGYIGYDDDFIFVRDENKMSEPLKDKTAGLFLEPSNQVMVCLLKGHPIKYSHEQSKKKFRENMRQVANSESQESYLIRYLFWDMQHQVCLGDRNVSL
ncbi:hypothetical protein KKE19_03410 [Patescibacteria group bacterium]|nr:hypothetical protein [Patescibacteria group bacterium]MBU4367804.1 hypothetical protein [Patescibacteria group bacterium]MBU4462182.1 hypothetical protein [Patescibacteria group bacterium]MCG2699943.1 hypothetical protein [Candidatus Parcubacteria bacterium]